MAVKKTSKKAAKKTSSKAVAAAAEQSVTVPSKNVGAACQAAVSFEGATRVVAEAKAGSSGEFVVTWS